MTSADLPGSLEAARPTAVRYLVLSALCAAATISYLCRNCIGVAEGTIRNELGITEYQMGWVMSAFFFSYAAGQIPGGWLGQVWGSRKALAAFSGGWSVFTLLTATSFNFTTLFVTRLGVGIAQTGIFPSSASTIAKWFPESRRAVACGSLGSFMSVGGAMAAALTGVLLESMSWRLVFAVFAVPGLVWAAWFFWWFRDRPTEHPSVNRAEVDLIRGPENGSAADVAPAAEPGKMPWAAIFSSGAMWLICGQQFLRAAGYSFYPTWFPRFLKETRGVSTLESGYLTSLPLLAVVVGSLYGGTVVDWLLVKTGNRRISRQGVAIGSMAACATFIGLAYTATDAVTAVLLITAGSFCASFAGSAAYTVTIDKAGDHIPMVFGTMNMAGNLGAAICPIVVERFVAYTNSWELVLVLFAGIYATAGLFWGLLDPNGTIFDRRKSS